MIEFEWTWTDIVNFVRHHNSIVLYIFKDPNLLEMCTDVFMGKMTLCLFCLFKVFQKKKIGCWEEEW